MKTIHRLLLFSVTFSLILLGCVSSQPDQKSTKPSKPKIIFDTDFGNDADDLGAIAMLHYYADQGDIELLAMMTWLRETYSLPALKGVNEYYGRPDLPIGARETQPWRTDWSHTKVIADQFGPDNFDETTIPGAVALYREILSGAEPHSITIVTVGPLGNIQNLLQSGADDISPLTGQELVSQKVGRFIIMGGQFPDGVTANGTEWNFSGNMKGVTQYVLATIDRPIVFSGYEVGEALKVGDEINDHPKDTPLYVGYKYFSEHAPWMKQDYVGDILNNSSFDQTAVIHAASDQANEFWTLSAPGTLTADEDGNATWTPSPGGQHRYIILTDDVEPTKAYIAERMMYVP